MTYPTTAVTNELRVTNLQPFKTYTFKVFSANEIGSSAASIEARISTEQGLPSAPLNLEVNSLIYLYIIFPSLTESLVFLAT